MHQIIQNIRNGKINIIQVPDPLVRSGHVLIGNAFSVVSAGTEKMVMELAKKSGSGGKLFDMIVPTAILIGTLITYSAGTEKRT